MFFGQPFQLPEFVVEEKADPGSVNAFVIAAIKAAGYTATRVYKVCPPHNSWDKIEVIFRGRFRGEKDVEKDTVDKEYRAFVPDEADSVAVVVEGW